MLVVANQGASHADDACLERCIDFLLQCTERRTLVLDEGYEILRKYATHCSWSGQPGVGDEFFLWAQTNAPQLHRVTLGKTAAGEYVDFPQDAALAGLDQDDRIWVAATVAAAPPTQLVNGVDSDYLQHATALASNGIIVEELCPHLLKTF